MEDETEFDILDVQQQQLVLDVLPNTDRVILNRKEIGARSQFWRMTSSGQLQHEGSSPPIDPRSGYTSRGENVLVSVVSYFNGILFKIMKLTNANRFVRVATKFYKIYRICNVLYVNLQKTVRAGFSVALKIQKSVGHSTVVFFFNNRLCYKNYNYLTPSVCFVVG